MIYGNSLRDFVIAIIVVDPDKLADISSKLNKVATDKSILDDIKQDVAADLKRLADDNKLNSLERPKQLILTMDAFTIENEILTPTMKLKRNVAAQIYKDQIEEAYAKGP